MPRLVCTCGSGLLPRYLKDPDGVVLVHVCDDCEGDKRALHLGEVFPAPVKTPTMEFSTNEP